MFLQESHACTVDLTWRCLKQSHGRAQENVEKAIKREREWILSMSYSALWEVDPNFAEMCVVSLTSCMFLRCSCKTPTMDPACADVSALLKQSHGRAQEKVENAMKRERGEYLSMLYNALWEVDPIVRKCVL